MTAGKRIRRDDYREIVAKLKADPRGSLIPKSLMDEFLNFDVSKTSCPEKLNLATYRNFKPYDNFKIDRDLIDCYYGGGLIDAKARAFLYEFFRAEFHRKNPGGQQRSGFYLSADGNAEVDVKKGVKKSAWSIFENSPFYSPGPKRNASGELCCSSCNSTNIQKREMVIDGGITKSVGIGFSTSGSAVIGLSRERTNLSKKAEFAREEVDGVSVTLILLMSGIAGAVGWLPGALIDYALGTKVSLYSASIFAVLGAVWGFLTVGISSLQESRADKSRAWICLTCGHKF